MISIKLIIKNIRSILCQIGLHIWYHGCFQTGQRSKFTGDHVGVRGRSCLYCNKKQQYIKNEYITVNTYSP